MTFVQHKVEQILYGGTNLRPRDLESSILTSQKSNKHQHKMYGHQVYNQ